MSEKVTIEVDGTYAELAPREAGFVAVAMKIASGTGECGAPGALCAYCTSKDCTLTEALKDMRKAMKRAKEAGGI